MKCLIAVIVLQQLVLAKSCFDNGDYTGSNLRRNYYVSRRSANECQQKCQQTPGCNYWTWDPHWHQACWMKTTKGRLNTRKSHLKSGPKYCKSRRSSKKGLAFSTKFYKNGGSCEDLKAFTGVSWYYNWGKSNPCQGKDAHFNEGFIPMIFNSKSTRHMSNQQGPKYILGFNEPNHWDQARMTPKEAAKLWPKIEAAYPDKKLVSPCPAQGGYVDMIKWFDEFFRNCRGCRVDYLATHSYTGSARADQKILTDLYKRYKKKIWFTEFAASKTTNPAKQLKYMKEMLPWLENSHMIHRYSWFTHRFTHKGKGHGWYLDRSISLMKENSQRLTELGRYYNEF